MPGYKQWRQDKGFVSIGCQKFSLQVQAGEKIHYLVGLQANYGGIGLDCYIDLRLEVDTGSRHSEGPK